MPKRRARIVHSCLSVRLEVFLKNRDMLFLDLYTGIHFVCASGGIVGDGIFRIPLCVFHFTVKALFVRTLLWDSAGIHFVPTLRGNDCFNDRRVRVVPFFHSLFRAKIIMKLIESFFLSHVRVGAN
jgi:hypothetical protein